MNKTAFYTLLLLGSGLIVFGLWTLAAVGHTGRGWIATVVGVALLCAPALAPVSKGVSDTSRPEESAVRR
ncbi:hypothetical protein GWK18_00390 [Kocuria sp. JC486]|uniref:Uncharacterized protein n=1 Tax=Kocuria soli TaxID=2485125 RepID=A0A3N3ZT26_9MICC|nr:MULTISPECIES: hypothetical protein [Kocuria]NHU84071.1 hypothetical protein [Kocuria sp. JC486]ROZ64771.1 hypothetical protein EDL96_02765 [Kocuria soli]